MALVKCPECGKEISDMIKHCPHCGYWIKDKKIMNKNLLIASIAIVVIVCVICTIKLFDNNKSPANQAITIIEADYGKDINIMSVYYNKEQNGRIIKFTGNGMSDDACVYLGDKSIGYESIYEEMAEKINDTSLSNEEKQNYATQIIEYPYDVVWVYNLLMNGTSQSGCEKVQ